jgi:hypothetical protein
MKATHDELVHAAELGIMRSIPDFLEHDLKPGRLKRLFLEIGMIVDGELRKIYHTNTTFFEDNKEELAEVLEQFGKITVWGEDKNEVHVSSVIAFCLAILEHTKSKYTPKLIELFVDVLDYYERVQDLDHKDLWEGEQFEKSWSSLYKK